MGFKLKKLKKYLNAKNALAIAASPFTAGASLALLNDGEGNDILGEITGKNSAKQANKQNIAQQNYWNERNIAEQRAVNEQSIELANTAHQREIADLKAAGLNPVLSAGGNGAGTPTLGTGIGQAAQVENTMPGGYLTQAAQVANITNMFSSAKQMATQAKLNTTNTEYAPQIAKSEINKNNAETAKINAETENIIQNTNNGGTGGTPITRTMNWAKNSAKAEFKKWKEEGKKSGWHGWKYRARNWLLNNN